MHEDAKWQKIVDAIESYGSAEFECGDWREDDEVAFDEYFNATFAAQKALLKLLGVPRKYWPLEALRLKDAAD